MGAGVCMGLPVLVPAGTAHGDTRNGSGAEKFVVLVWVAEAKPDFGD